ncbi:MAG: hypothetical protein R3242_05900 [Akkermansiaceae bacterium]|nr:hypothetical protein [Akkermansiaceae bacterium]
MLLPIRWIASVLCLTVMMQGGMVQAQEEETPDIDPDRMVVLPWLQPKREVPLFYSVKAKVEATVELGEIATVQKLLFKVHQGKGKTLSVALSGEGKILDVVAKISQDPFGPSTPIEGWALRTEIDGKRYLDIHTASDGADRYPEELEVTVKTESKWEGSQTHLLLPGPDGATGFSLDLKVYSNPLVNVKVLQVEKLSQVDLDEEVEGLHQIMGDKPRHYLGHELSSLRLEVTPSGLKAEGLEILDSRLFARLAEDGRSVSYRLEGRLRSEKADARLELLAGPVAIMDATSGDGWRIGLSQNQAKQWVHELVATREGEFPIRLEFGAPVAEAGDWRQVDFTMLAGVVVPVRLEGFEKGVEFSGKRPLVPRERGGRLVGFLPPTGKAAMAWRKVDEVEDGSLFFSSTEVTDVRVGSGLMRQRSVIDLRVLQGKLTKLVFDMAGEGEILSVNGDSTVVGWKVIEKGGKRQLEVSLSRPIDKQKRLVIESQVGMSGKPLQAQAIRISPEGALRHSGWLRVANEGSVRVEVMDAKGLIQLAPHQFPAGEDKSLRQAVVYRFPSADYDYRVNASQVLPEISVNEVTIYELGESDRRILSDLELDIREAPVREWSLQIPADHAVSSVLGAQVADYAVGSEVVDGMRTLTVLFKGPVMNRQLVRVEMARNQAPEAGAWAIQPLGFKEVKSRRGYVGAVATAGYRLEVAKSEGLAEIPVSFFPNRANGLQQAFRLRDMSWSLDLKVEALGQSVQADVFHLYSLKSGAAYGSVIINYFVVGSPATEWRIEVPEGVGNIDVSGLNVGRDWRKEGNTVIVPLSRPVLGAATVGLTFEQPMSAQGGDISPGAVTPLDVQGERGVIQVVSPLQVNHSSSRKGSLLEIDASEVPMEFQLLSAAPTLKAWQYTARDFEIDMQIDWFEPGETIDQVVDFQELHTHISRDGQWVTDAQIFVRSKGRGVIRMKLPEGSKLWEARVNGKPVNARVDGADILVPLKSNDNPKISIRYGAQSEKASKPVVAAPQFDVPVVIGEWKVEGDEGQRLIPDGGSAASLTQPVLMQTGWQWMAQQSGILMALLLLGLLAWVLLQGKPGGAQSVFGLTAGMMAIVLSVIAGIHADETTYLGSSTLEYAAPVVGANEAITIEVLNQSEFAARLSWGVILLMVLGVAMGLVGLFKKARLQMMVGTTLVLASVLSIRGGAAPFFVFVAIALGFWWVTKLLREFAVWSERRKKRLKAKAKAAATASLLALMFGMTPSEANAAPEPAIQAAESVQHDWDIREGRLYGSVGITLTGEAGDRYLLLDHPAVLNRFVGDGLKVIHASHGGGRAYWLIATRDGRLNGTAEFEMPVQPAKGWKLPTGPAAQQRVKLKWDQSGWEFTSPAAVKVEELNVGNKASGAVISLSPMQDVVIQAQARQRDVSTEKTQFYSEVSNLFIPGPGVVNGRHLVKIRPAQGQVRQLTLKVPKGYTVSDVGNGPIGNWRFDPDSRELRVIVQPAQSEGFRFLVETQRSAGDLPVDLEVSPLRVEGASGEVGLIGMAFGDEVQPEGLKPIGLSKVNPSDFDHSLIPVANNQPLAVLLHAFRYGSGEASLSLRVNPVAPELRSHVWQLISLGEDRLLVTADVDVMITRAGVFRLQLAVPDSLEVESATGEGLSHWTQLEGEEGQRIITLHLTGKSIGERSFSLALVGRPVTDSEKWMAPKVKLLDASRETGVLTVVPERGLRVRAIERKHISQLDARELAGQSSAVARAAVRPDALSYRLLQSDWVLGLSIRRLEPWVTAQVFHDSTIREGQVLNRLHINYRIDNAAVKSRRVKITGLDEKAAATLRASGSAVADFVPVDGSKELWEIRFRRGVAGRCEVTLEYQRPSAESGRESIMPIELVDVRQTQTILSLRAGGRLELEVENTPRGWVETDWSAVKSQVGSQAGPDAPHLTFKVADPEGPLTVIMKRHDLANLRKIRVSEGTLTSLLSPEGNVLTSASMLMQVVDKSTLRLKLPAGAKLFHVSVNGESAPLVREGDEWLFYVFPNPETGEPSELRFTYSAEMADGKKLQGPVLDVPMENLNWRVMVPEGWELGAYGGDFELKNKHRGSMSQTESYQTMVASKTQGLKSEAIQLFDKGNEWASSGDQEKAIKAYRNVLNSGQLDAASTEDARVQLRKIKTQQALLGLNSRRQRVIIDNQSADEQQQLNDQIGQAASVNPVLQGNYNYDPNQFERFLDGNTAEENAALKEIASCVVAQQLAAEPAPAALDITLPERGTVLNFGRSVQVGSDEAMVLEIELDQASSGFSLLAVLLCLAIPSVVFLKPRGSKKG